MSTDFKMKFMDGAPVSEEYIDMIQLLLDAACEAEEKYGIDEVDESC